ncbi:MAG: AAA family ATPase, partial [Nanoarchaeota archaeon]
MNIIINREEAEELKQKKYWCLVYGRRKVGKTFLLKNLCSFNNLYTVKKDSSIFSEGRNISLSQLKEEVAAQLSKNNTLVIDEFQRLNQSIIEEWVTLHPKGRLILSGSSLRVIKKIFEPQSPLLGFFVPLKIGFIKALTMLRGLKKNVKGSEILELAAFLREPWLIPLYEKGSSEQFVFDTLTKSKHTISALIGEIFTEEEREISKKYNALLSLIGSGVWNTKELTSTMYSRNLIPDPSPTHIQQYLKNLEEMELVDSIKIYNSKKNYYRLKSPMMNVYYYLNDRYDLDREPSFEELKPTIQKLINLEVQNFIADLFSEIIGGRKEYYVSKDKEIDFIITKRNKAVLIGEV